MSITTTESSSATSFNSDSSDYSSDLGSEVGSESVATRPPSSTCHCGVVSIALCFMGVAWLLTLVMVSILVLFVDVFEGGNRSHDVVKQELLSETVVIVSGECMCCVEETTVDEERRIVPVPVALPVACFVWGALVMGFSVFQTHNTYKSEFLSSCNVLCQEKFGQLSYGWTHGVELESPVDTKKDDWICAGYCDLVGIESNDRNYDQVQEDCEPHFAKEKTIQAASFGGAVAKMTQWLSTECRRKSAQYCQASIIRPECQQF